MTDQTTYEVMELQAGIGPGLIPIAVPIKPAWFINQVNTRAAVVAAVTALGAALLVSFSVAMGVGKPADWHSGPFWGLPLAWLGVAVLAGIAVLVEHPATRVLAVLLFGVATIGLLGIIEPFGVFHDSWRNIGLGQLALSPEYAGQAYSNPYIGASPGGFLLLGLLRSIFPSTVSMLTFYPLLTMVVYCTGVYMLSIAFYDTHLESGNPQRRMRFGLLGVLVFLASASLFSVRVNPAPQSVAFAILPFFLAVVLRSRQGARYRLLALGLFGAIVLTHPITSMMAAAICGVFFLADIASGGRTERIISLNSVLTYSSLFLAWLIYIGVWVLQSGGEFLARMISVLNSDQHAAVAAGGGAALWDFVWTHRVAMALAGVLVLAGLVVAWRTNRSAGLRLAGWLGISAVWLPLMFLGEFGDRGPLFASLPVTILIAFLLDVLGSDIRWRAARWLVGAAVVGMSVTAFGTAYTNHAGEVVTGAEVDAFSAIVKAHPQERISYGYVPPFTGADLPIYTSDRIRAYALGAADFSYDRLLRQNGIIAVSEGMREAIALRGSGAQEAYDAFLLQLEDEHNYQLIYSNSYVKAYRAR